MQIKGYSTGHYGFLHEYSRMNGGNIPLEVMVKRIAESGVQAFESDPTDELAGLAKTFGLKISATYVGFDLHDEIKQSKLDVELLPLLERMGRHEVNTLLLNADPKGGWLSPQVKTEDELKLQGENITRISEITRAHGIECCFHNHGATKPLAAGDLRSVTEFGAKDINLCIDTGWAHVAGFDPIEWIRMYANRVTAVHLRNQWGPIPSVQLAEGELNVVNILTALEDIGYSGWMTLELYHVTSESLSVAEATRISAAWIKEFYCRKG